MSARRKFRGERERKRRRKRTLRNATFVVDTYAEICFGSNEKEALAKKVKKKNALLDLS